MLADAVTPGKARSHALQAGIGLLLLALLSTVNFNLFGLSISFLFVPLVLVYLWPKSADDLITYLALFICGLFLDLLTGGYPGMWPLIFILGLVFLRPNLMNREAVFFVSWIGYIFWALVLALVFLLLDFWAKGNIEMKTLTLQLLVSVLVFPAIYMARVFVRGIVIDEDE